MELEPITGSVWTEGSLLSICSQIDNGKFAPGLKLVNWVVLEGLDPVLKLGISIMLRELDPSFEHDLLVGLELRIESVLGKQPMLVLGVRQLEMLSSRVPLMWALEDPASLITRLTLGSSSTETMSCSSSTLIASRGGCCCSEQHPRR
jgi:hypothetical protein